MIHRFLVIAFVLCCALDGNAQETSIASEVRRSLEARIREGVVSEGSFQKLVVGAPKNQVLEGLGSMGVEHIHPDLRGRIVVTRADELERLRSAEGIIVGAGSVIVEFRDDDVVRLLVAPVLLKWNSLLAGAKTRNDVFDGLREILERFDGVVVRNIAPDARYVRVDGSNTEGAELLSRFDLWRVSYRSEEGYWHLRLEFEAGCLARISIWHSPVELP